MIDYFKVLGLDYNSTDKLVKAAYRSKVAQYHPDKVLEVSQEKQEKASKAFKKVSDAYNALKDEKGRRNHRQKIKSAVTDDPVESLRETWKNILNLNEDVKNDTSC